MYSHIIGIFDIYKFNINLEEYKTEMLIDDYSNQLDFVNNQSIFEKAKILQIKLNGPHREHPSAQEETNYFRKNIIL